MTKDRNDIKSDVTLIDQLQYFKELFLKYYDMLCVYSLRYVKDIDVSKDIVQDSFVDLWEKRDELDMSTSLKSLLYRYVHNKSIDYTRHLSSNNETLNEKVIEHPLDLEWSLILSEQIDEDIDCKIITDEVNKCLDELSPKCADIFRMSREQGMTNKEIAEKLQVTIKSVEKQKTKAISFIREHLMNSGYLTMFLFALLLMKK
jgi:RNA polymerase sigma-70 factor (family 1)